MRIVNNEQMCNQCRVYSYLPRRIRGLLYAVELEGLEEIRLRQGLPVMLHYKDTAFFLSSKGNLKITPENALCATKKDLEEGLELITRSSLYAVEQDLKKGFITISGGHRIGVCGTAVPDAQGIGTLKDISGLNYRIARECIGISDKLMEQVLWGGQVKNTLILSPPGCGKTTLLRDMVRNLSVKGKKVSLIDERGELSARSDGYSGYDLGVSCDVLEGAPKEEGMLLMLRSMSPDVIATDELGTEEDVRAVLKVIHSGVHILATAHCTNREEFLKHPVLRELYPDFQCFITLSRKRGVGTVEEVYCDL